MQASSPSYDLFSVDFVDQNTGWAVGDGGTILKTTNGGTNWILQTSGTTFNLWSVDFVDQNIGWSVGGDGTILNTTDGGTTWILQTSNASSTLYSVKFVDQNTGWAVGKGGTIIKTTNGGVPVELTTFEAKLLSGKVHLSWTTATETNNYGFEVERASSSTTPIQGWEKIGFVPGSGNSSSPKEYTYTDKLPTGSTKLKYRLKQIDNDGSYEYSEEVEVELNTPLKFELLQNYPNPFNPSTKISWQSPVSSWQTLRVYDVLGNEIATLVDEYKPAGNYEVEFDASSAVGYASGVYFYQLKVGENVATKKMLLMR